MDAESFGRHQVATVQYENIKYAELISEYKQAYKEAGFVFKFQKKIKDGSTELHFEIPIPEYPYKKAGFVTFGIYCLQYVDKNHPSCSIHRIFFGVEREEYSAEELKIALEKVRSADLKAAAYIVAPAK